MEFWIFHQQIMEVKFKHKILLEFAENNTGWTHSVQELLYAIKSKDSRMVLECVCVKDEETQYVCQVLFEGCTYTKKINPNFTLHLCELSCHWCKK